jgi:hypothetical protein
MDKWSHKQDNAFLLKSFSLIKKNENESMEEFNSRFMKSYNKIPQTVRPNPASALIFYIEQFDGLFGVFLKQKEPQDLEGAFQGSYQDGEALYHCQSSQDTVAGIARSTGQESLTSPFSITCPAFFRTQERT